MKAEPTKGKQQPYRAFAEQLGITRRHLLTLRQHPDWNDEWTVNDARTWMEARHVTDDEVRQRNARAIMRKNEAEAAISEMNQHEREGALMNRAEIEQDNARAGEALKNNLLTLGSRLHQQVISLLTDPADGAQVEQMADDLVRGALTACVAELEKHEVKGE